MRQISERSFKLVTSSLPKTLNPYIGGFGSDHISGINCTYGNLITYNFDRTFNFPTSPIDPDIDRSAALAANQFGNLFPASTYTRNERVIDPNKLITTQHSRLIGRSAFHNAGHKKCIFDRKIFNSNSIKATGKILFVRLILTRRKIR